MTENLNGKVSMIGILMIFVWHGIVLLLLAEPRFSRRKCIVIDVVTMAAMTLVCYALMFTLGFARALTFAGVIALAVFIVMFCVISRGSIPKKVFLCLAYCNYFCVTTQLSFLAANLLFGVNDPRYQVAAIISRNLINLIAVPFYFKFIHPRFRGVKITQGREWWSLSIVSVLFTATYLVQSVTAPNTMDNFTQFFPIMIMVYIQGTASCIMIFRTISYMNKNAEIDLMAQNTRFLNEQIDRLAQNENKVRQLRHDMRHHLTNIAEHIRRGDNAAALEYLKNCESELDTTSQKSFCKNVTLDNIISAYSRRAERMAIPFSCKAKAGANLRLRDIDLVAILANLLENALNESQKDDVAQPNIEVYISDEDKRLVIVVNNSCGSLELAGKFPKSCGIGISSVISAVEKYSGSIDYTVEGGVCSVCAAIEL